MTNDHRFDVWAPHAREVTVRVEGVDHPMEGLAERPGWWTLAEGEQAASGTVRYGYLLTKVFDEGTDKERTSVSDVLPDPRSRRQPQGVHDLSCTFDPEEFQWSDAAWRPPLLKDSVLYELHPGTFTPEGTLDSAIEKLDYLADLGVEGVRRGLHPIGRAGAPRGPDVGRHVEQHGEIGGQPAGGPRGQGGDLGAIERAARALVGDRGVAVAVRHDPLPRRERGFEQVGDVLGAIGGEEQRLGARAHRLTGVEQHLAQRDAQARAARLARGYDVVPGLLQGIAQRIEHGGLARALAAFQRDEMRVAFETIRGGGTGHCARACCSR